MMDSEKDNQNYLYHDGNYIDKNNEPNENNENIQNYENNLKNIGEINNLNNGIIEEKISNSLIKLFIENETKINDEKFNIDNTFLQKNLNPENNNNPCVLTKQFETINGKKIATSNEFMDDIFYKLFQNTELNADALKDMQFCKKKRRRRTKKEIEADMISGNKSPKMKKNRGRNKRDSIEHKKNELKHSKESDDNIIKLINTSIFESIRNWINKSLIDEKHLNFQNQKNLKKNKNQLLRLEPKLISNQIKKKERIEILNKKIKEIYSTYPISSKYIHFQKDTNKNLIEKIFIENKQPFVMYILNLTFLEALNYYNGKITDQIIIDDFKKKNFKEGIIHKFISNFEKIDKLFVKLYNKHIKENNQEEVKKYLTRIKVLSLNYKESFDNKFERTENKRTKVSDSKDN